MPQLVWNESKKPCLTGTIAGFPGKLCDLNQSPPPPTPSPPPPPLSPPPLLQESLDELELSDEPELSDEQLELELSPLNQLAIFQPLPLLLPPLEL
jgi:hypothetical protein